MDEKTIAERKRSPYHQAVLNRNLRNDQYSGFDNIDKPKNFDVNKGLVGDFGPKYLLNRERPWHRTVINMAAAGYTNTEISKAVGRDVGVVENTLRQPFAREYLINEAKKTVQDEIKAVLESQALPSIQMLVAVRDDELANASVKLSAANSLLDRFLGKPVQPMTTNAKAPSDMSDAELREQVERELAQTKAN